MRTLARVYRRLRERGRAGLGFLREATGRYPVVYNVNGADESRHVKRALLLYRIRSFLLSESDPEFFSHHNIRRCKQIATVLGELGYVVDAASGRDARLRRPRGRYDLVISDRADLRGRFDEGTRKVFVATALNHVVHNRSLQRRHELLAARRRCAVRRLRIYPESMPYIARADAIVAVGSRNGETWRELFSGPIHAFNNAAFRETEFALDGKDFARARRHFLFFASRAQVQKGLDLLLEIFPRLPGLDLYVCSMFEREKDFCECYHLELYQTPNVHPIGWIQVNSPEFGKLVRRCAYVILPSCAEGQPGSVVQCMAAGLIPLVTREAGIDTEDFGVTFADDSLAAIRQTVLEVAERPEAWHRERSLRTRRAVEEKYSETALCQRWREILTSVQGR